MIPAEILAFVRELMLLGLILMLLISAIRGGGGGSGRCCCPEGAR